METYQSGRTEPHSKCGCHESGTWVRIPPFPPLENCTHTRENEKGVQFFFLHECFGIVIPFDKPKVDNAGWQNWKTQKRDGNGNFCKQIIKNKERRY